MIIKKDLLQNTCKQKLDKITHKNKEQQQQYNEVLKEMAKITPNLVAYDSNGSPISARENAVRNLLKAYHDAIAEQKKLKKKCQKV